MLCKRATAPISHEHLDPSDNRLCIQLAVWILASKCQEVFSGMDSGNPHPCAACYRASNCLGAWLAVANFSADSKRIFRRTVCRWKDLHIAKAQVGLRPLRQWTTAATQPLENSKKGSSVFRVGVCIFSQSCALRAEGRQRTQESSASSSRRGVVSRVTGRLR